MSRKTKKNKKGGFSIFRRTNNNKEKKRNSSSIRRSAEKRRKILEKINKEKGIDALKKNKCLIQYKNCMNVSSRKSI